MTLKKLAELSGVSVGTVSKAFSGSDEISEATRERIFAIAKESFCFDKYYKAPRKRPLIALLFPEPESEYYAKSIGIFERAFNERGADVIIAFTRFDREAEARLFRELAYGMKVDGVIISGSGELISNPDEIPLLTISSKHLAENSDTLFVELDRGISELIETVKRYGHRRVGFIGEALTTLKEKKFREAMRVAGLPVCDEYIAMSGERFEAAGEDGMRLLVERGELPSVIIAAYDRIAYGAIRCARDHGISVPDDVSFVGMDDISSTPYFDLPLSTLHIDFESAAEDIVELMFARIKNRHYRSRERISIPVVVKIRESLKSMIDNI